MQRAIGVFDSGVGGLSVLKHIRNTLPAEDLIYIADTAFMPYGCKPEAVIRKRCLEISDYFIRQHVKAIVVACNTATAAAVEQIRGCCEIPVIGMEPPVKPAVDNSRSGVVGVLATSGTVSSERFHHLKERFAADATLLVQPCPGLVECVEKGDISSAHTRSLLQHYLNPLLEQGVDSIVLGCTHYPYLMQMIAEVSGAEVKIVDTGDAIARELKRQLQAVQMLADKDRQGEACFYATGASNQVMVSRLWGHCVELLQLDI